MTAGTVFHRTRLPLLTWFWAIFFVARHSDGVLGVPDLNVIRASIFEPAGPSGLYRALTTPRPP